MSPVSAEAMLEELIELDGEITAEPRRGISDQQLIGAIRRHTESPDDWTASGPLVAYLGVARNTVHQRLRRLIADGTVEKKGQQRATRYRLVGRGKESGAAAPIMASSPPSAPNDDLSPLRPVGPALRMQAEPLRDPEAELVEEAQDTRGRVRKLAEEVMAQREGREAAA